MNQPPKYLKQSIRALFKELNLPITQIMWSYDKYICYFRRKRVQSGYRMSAKRTIHIRDSFDYEDLLIGIERVTYYEYQYHHTHDEYVVPPKFTQLTEQFCGETCRRYVTDKIVSNALKFQDQEVEHVF